MPIDWTNHFSFLWHNFLKQCNSFCVDYRHGYFNQLKINILILSSVVLKIILDNTGCHCVIN